MKLHLPSGLRKALLTVLSALPVSTMAVMPTANADTKDEIKAMLMTETTGVVENSDKHGSTYGIDLDLSWLRLGHIYSISNEFTDATVSITGKSEQYWEWFQQKWSDPKLLVQGTLNTVDHSTLYSKNSSVTLNGAEQGSAVDILLWAGLMDYAKSILAGYGLTNVSDADVYTLLNQSANIVQDSSTLQAGTNVTLDAKVNMVSSSTLNAGETVNVTGGINAMLGADIDGKYVKFTGSAVNLGEIATLYPMAKDKLTRGGEDIMGIPVATVDKLVEAIKGSALKDVNASANMLMGGEVDAEEKVTLSATGNIIAGGTNMTAGSIEMTGVDTSVNLSALADILGDKTLMSGLPLPGAAGDLLGLVTPMLGTGSLQTALGDKLSANLVYGGGTDVVASGNITMTALGNVVAQNAEVRGNNVTMTGLANMVALKTPTDDGASVIGYTSVTMDGMANIVYDGKVIGKTIEMGMSPTTNKNPYAGLLSAEQLVSLIPDELPSSLAGFDLSQFSGITDLNGDLQKFAGAMTGPINVNVVMGHDALVGGEDTDKVTMNGTANVLISGATVQGNKVTMNGTANMVLGGAKVFGTTIEMNGTPLTLEETTETGTLGSLAGSMLGLDFVKSKLPLSLPTGTEGLLSSLVDSVSENLSVNLVYGGISKVGNTATQTVTMSALGNIVAQNAAVTAKDVTMTGLANIVALKANNGNGAVVNGSDSVNMDGMLNVVYDGGRVMGGVINMGMHLNDKTNPYSSTLELGELASSITGSGMLGAMLGTDLGGMANGFVTALPGLISGQYGPGLFNMNLVMGPNALVSGKEVRMNGVINMLADRTKVHGDNYVQIGGFTNVVTDGASVSSNSGMELAGTLNFLSHLTLADAEGLLKDGKLPDRTFTTTTLTANKDINLWGTANVLLGNVKVESKGGDVRMGGKGPILGLDKLSIADCVLLADQMGLDLNEMVKDENMTIAQLLEMAGKGDDPALVTKAKDALASLITALDYYKDTDIPTGILNSNVNVVMGGAEVHALNGAVTMNGTANVVYGNIFNQKGLEDRITEVQGKTVEMNGMANLVLGGADVIGTDVVMHGVDRHLHLGAMGSYLVNHDMLGGLELPKGALTVLNSVNGSVNLVYGGSTNVFAYNNFTMDALANIVAKNAHVDVGGKMTMSGALNVVAAGAVVDAGNFSMLGNGSPYINWKAMMADEQFGKLAQMLQGRDPNMNLVAEGAQLNVDNMLRMDGSANVIMGGADLTANTIYITSGGANVVADTTLQNIADLLGGNEDAFWTGGTNPTTLTANTINISGLANILNGGYVRVNATEGLTIKGAGNVISGNAQLSGKDVTLRGSGRTDIDWAGMLPVENEVLSSLLQQYEPNVNLVANGAQITAGNRLWMDATANVIMGGADLSAKTIDIVSGGVNVVADTTLQNIAELLGGNEGSAITGGFNETTLTATGNLTLRGLANIVNGGRVSLKAGNAVNMIGALNLVGGGKSLDPNIQGKDVNMIGSDAIQLNLSNNLPAEYAALGKVFDKVTEEGVSANIVAGGAKVKADNNITMNGMVSAVVDTTLDNVLDAYTTGSIAPLIAGGVHETTLTAGNSIHMDSKLNLVNGGMVSLSAGNKVTLEGVMNYVGGDAQVKTTNANGTVTLAGAVNAVLMGADITADSIELKGNPRLTEAMNGLVNSFVPGGVSQNVCVSAGVVAGEGTSLKAKNSLHMNDNLNLVAEGASVSSGKTAYIEGTANAVMTGAAVTGKDVLMHGSFGNAVLEDATVTATTGNIELKSSGLSTNDVEIAGAVAGQLKDGILGEALSTLLPDNAYVELLKDKAHYLQTGAEILTAGGLNVVAGGADLNAEKGSVLIEGGMNVVMDATLGDMLTLVDQDNTTWPGEGAETTVTAGRDINMEGNVNVVMGDKAKLDAAKNVTMNGTAAIVTADAVVKAGQDIELNTASKDNGLMGDIADKVVAHPTANKIADTFLPNHTDLADKLNAYGNINVVTDGATLDAGNDVKFNSSMNVVDTATVMAGNNIAFNGGKTEVTNATLSAGNQVVISGGAGASTYSSRTTIDYDFTMTGGRMEAENGLIVKDNAKASISQAELVLGGTSSVEAGSTLSLAELTVNPGAKIVNYGTLSLDDVVMTNATVTNVGTMTVTGALTMDNATLNYSGTTYQMTDGVLAGDAAGAIGLDGNGALTLGSTSADAIHSVSFVVDAALLADTFATGKEFSFVLFTNATDADLAFVNQYLAETEFHVGVANSSWNTIVSNMTVSQVGSNIVVNATVMVPEPTTATLSLLALAGLAARRRRRH